MAAGSKKPATAQQLQPLLQPTAVLIQEVVQLRERNRPSPLFNHLSAVSEGVPALGWVAVEPKPVPFVGEMKDAAQFYVNRILKEYKDKEKVHGEWAQAFTAVLLELQAYVKKFHTTGLVWNPHGAVAKLPEDDGAEGESANGHAAGAGGAAPPPPPPGMLFQSPVH